MMLAKACSTRVRQHAGKRSSFWTWHRTCTLSTRTMPSSKARAAVCCRTRVFTLTPLFKVVPGSYHCTSLRTASWSQQQDIASLGRPTYPCVLVTDASGVPQRGSGIDFHCCWRIYEWHIGSRRVTFLFDLRLRRTVTSFKRAAGYILNFSLTYLHSLYYQLMAVFATHRDFLFPPLLYALIGRLRFFIMLCSRRWRVLFLSFIP